MLKKIINLFLISLTTLTRFKLPVKIDYSKNNLINSVIFYQLIGLLIGIFLYYIVFIMMFLNFKIYFITIIIIIIPYLLNNFFHFDGLCDVLDSFLANKSKEKRLEIMKDPNIGSFALGGSIIFFLLKFIFTYNFFIEKINLFFLIIIPFFSRYAIIILSYKSIYPRDSGTGSFIIGKINNILLLLSNLFFVVLLLLLFYFYKVDTKILFTIIILYIFLIFFLFIFKFYSYKKIGGITGDVLGAFIELSELLMLIFITGLKYVFL